MNAKNLEVYFSSTAIVRFLCNKRLRSAISHRKEQFINGLTLSKARHVPMEIRRLLPPRRQWPRAGTERRTKQGVNPLRSRAELLARFVLRALRDKNARQGWVRRLRAFIEEVRSSALNWAPQHTMRPRQTIGIPKGRAGSGQKYRLVSTYALRETVLASGYSSYLRGRLEPRLGLECLAYRSAKPDQPPPTHHEAVNKILEYAHHNRNKDLWVAECDLKGFFDNLKHSTVRKSIKRILSSRSPDDRRTRYFIESFLRGYSFASGCDDAIGRLGHIGVFRADFGRPVDAGDSHTGVAQGSSISCIVANAVLYEADRAVLAADSNSTGLFLRYSDDTIFIAPSQQQCEAMLNAYLTKIRKIGIPVHTPKAIPAYGPEFWSGKSRLPYKWSSTSQQNTSPWLAFVGYHIKRSLEIRARPTSIQKESKKQLAVADQVISELCRVSARSKRPLFIRKIPAILFRVKQYMMAFSVGRPIYRTLTPSPDALCWVKGFEMLNGSAAARPGLARLDRSRTQTLARLAGRLHGLLNSGAFLEGNYNVNRRHRFIVSFLGSPLSYYKQFHRREPEKQ